MICINKCKLKTININDPFFYSFKSDYKDYVDWFKRKSEDFVYIVYNKLGRVGAMLKLKIEYKDEDYSDIVPTFKPNTYLKICTFKVATHDKNIGSMFLQIIKDFAVDNGIDNIYVTIMNNSKEKKSLIKFLEKNNYKFYGKKGYEIVYKNKL